MTKGMIRMTEVIFITLFVGTNTARHIISTVNIFKGDFARISGFKDAKLNIRRVSVNDMNVFYINRDLDKLSLASDAVYLLKYISNVFRSFNSIKRLVLISDVVNSSLANTERWENYKRKTNLKDVNELEAYGTTAITEALSGIFFDIKIPIRVLKLHSDLPILFKSIQRTRNNPHGIIGLFHRELQIEGQISSTIIKAIHEGSGKETETISIKGSSGDIPHIRRYGSAGIIKGPQLRNLILNNDAIMLAFANEHPLLNSKIEPLFLNGETPLNIL
eukprot:GHVP01031031.1.p1 GENE.GHVP01031031.1~~GHVP01031031.1.p1  ORF type:complete len:276 (+),score=26.21 GHVP01031031.1:63-890(+)